MLAIQTQAHSTFYIRKYTLQSDSGRAWETERLYHKTHEQRQLEQEDTIITHVAVRPLKHSFSLQMDSLLMNHKLL